MSDAGRSAAAGSWRPDIDALVRRVAGAAASLPERGRASWLVRQATPADVVDERLQRWRRQAAGADQAAFAELCRARAIGDPGRWVSDVAVAPGATLPSWAIDLGAFLRAAVAVPDDADRQAVSRLTANGVLFLPDALPVPVSEGAGVDALAPAIALLRRALRPQGAAAHALAGDLCDHFAELLMSTFAGLLVRDGLPEGPDVVTGWADLLAKYPAVGRCLGLLIGGYLGYSAELCQRLHQDAGPLAALAGLPAARATGCRPGAGDRHSGLRTVTIVELLGGARVVYKPRDLRHVDALARIVAAAGLELSLPERLVRDGYGWEAFVEAAEPAKGRQRRRAARELGAWAFLLGMLGTTDLISENVQIAAGRLVPVDVETLFRFYLDDPSNGPWVPPAAAIGLFSAPVLAEAARKVPDVGLLTGAGRVLLDYCEDVVAGYAEAAARSGARKLAVLDELVRAGDTPFRAMLRNTWVYGRILGDSLHAEALVDGVARDLVLERLWVARVRASLPTGLVTAEIASIRRLDIPLFTCVPAGTDLFAAAPDSAVDAAACRAAALSEPPLAGPRVRAAGLGDAADPAQLDAVRAAMFCAAQNRDVVPPPGGAPPGRADGDGIRAACPLRCGCSRPPDWTARAAAAARESARWLRAGGPDGAALAAGLVYVTRNDVVTLSAERPFDLFSGAPGIAVALASLARLSADPSTREAAEAACAEAEAAACAFADDLAMRAGRGWPPRSTGAYEGAAALAVFASSTGRGVGALERCGHVLARLDPDSAAPGSRAVEALAGLATAAGSAAARSIPGAASLRHLAVGLLRSARDCAAGTPRFASRLGMLIPSERALVDLALARSEPEAISGPDARGEGVAGSGDRLVAAALNPAHLRPLTHSALCRLDTLAVLAELEVCLVASRRAEPFAAAAAAAGAVLLARRDATGRWFGDSLAPDRFRLSAVWGTTAAAHLLSGLAAPGSFSSIRLLEPVNSRT